LFHRSKTHYVTGTSATSLANCSTGKACTVVVRAFSDAEISYREFRHGLAVRHIEDDNDSAQRPLRG